MQIDRVQFFVDDARKWRDWFVKVMGFQSLARGRNDHTDTEVVGSGGGGGQAPPPVTFVLSSPLTSASPAAEFLRRHPPGVADVAFAVPDLRSLLERAIASGAAVREPIQQWESGQGKLEWSQIIGKAGLAHTLIQRTGMTPLLPDLWMAERRLVSPPEIKFTGIDHVVLNVGSGELEPTVSWYERALGLQKKQCFKIQTDRSGLHSQVMVNPQTGVRFPINEPASKNSQIQEFLDINRGPGIQHIALKTPGIAQVTRELKESGMNFLKTPQNYYENLKYGSYLSSFLELEWSKLVEQEILVDLEIKGDCQSIALKNPPILLQIFTETIFEKPTFFFELIERRGQARGFGEGNFQALYEAIEREQIERGGLRGQ